MWLHHKIGKTQKMYFAPDTKYIDVGFDGSLLHAGIRECLSI